MEYKVNFDVNNFSFWCGAKDRVNKLDYDTLQRLGDLIEETFSEETPTDTQINDFVWFDWEEFICPTLGIDDDGNALDGEEEDD